MDDSVPAAESGRAVVTHVCDANYFGDCQECRNDEEIAHYTRVFDEYTQNKAIKLSESSLDIWKVLHDAARYNKVRVIQLLLDYGANIAMHDGKRYTALHVAARYGAYDVVKLLLESGININAIEGYYGYTAMHYAAEKNYVYIVALLIDRNADLYVTCSNVGNTALHVAAYYGHLDVVQQLLTAKVDSNLQARLHRNTPLFLAIGQGNLAVAKLLLDAGARVDLCDNMGRTALRYAASKSLAQDSLNIVELLLRHGADINAPDAEGKTALHEVVDVGHISKIQFLLDHGANPNVKDSQGRTALHVAAEWTHFCLASMLIEEGANINTQDKAGRTALQIALDSRNREIISFLLKHNPDKSLITLRDKANEIQSGMANLFHTAIQDDDKALVQFFLDVDQDFANVYEGAHARCSPLCTAIECDNYAITNLLIQRGADIEAAVSFDSRDLPIHRAIKKGSVAILKLLIESGANLEYPGDYHWMPVTLALRKDSVRMTRILWCAGADFSHLMAHYQNTFMLLRISALAGIPNIKAGFDRGELEKIMGKYSCAQATYRTNAIANIINERDMLGATPLMYAATRGRFALVKALLEQGADPLIETDKGETVFHLLYNIIDSLPDGEERKNYLEIEKLCVLYADSTSKFKELRRIQVFQLMRDAKTGEKTGRVVGLPEGVRHGILAYALGAPLSKESASNRGMRYPEPDPSLIDRADRGGLFRGYIDTGDFKFPPVDDKPSRPWYKEKFAVLAVASVAGVYWYYQQYYKADIKTNLSHEELCAALTDALVAKKYEYAYKIAESNSLVLRDVSAAGKDHLQDIILQEENAIAYDAAESAVSWNLITKFFSKNTSKNLHYLISLSQILDNA